MLLQGISGGELVAVPVASCVELKDLQGNSSGYFISVASGFRWQTGRRCVVLLWPMVQHSK